MLVLTLLKQELCAGRAREEGRVGRVLVEHLNCKAAPLVRQVQLDVDRVREQTVARRVWLPKDIQGSREEGCCMLLEDWPCLFLRHAPLQMR